MLKFEYLYSKLQKENVGLQVHKQIDAGASAILYDICPLQPRLSQDVARKHVRAIN